MGGGMETNKNKFIEDWGSARENLEKNFRWTRRNLALVGIFGIAIPVFVYKGIVKEFSRSLHLYKKWATRACKEGMTNLLLLKELQRILGDTTLFFIVQKHMQDEDAGRPYRKFL